VVLWDVAAWCSNMGVYTNAHQLQDSEATSSRCYVLESCWNDFYVLRWRIRLCCNTVLCHAAVLQAVA
jgi:hypothetical protein